MQAITLEEQDIHLGQFHCNEKEKGVGYMNDGFIVNLVVLC